MSEAHIVLTADERDLLTRMLNQAVRDKRVEIHRTEFSIDFRKRLELEEEWIRDILGKLAQTASAT